MHRAASVPSSDQDCASGGRSSAWDPQGSRSPHSSNADQLCHHPQGNVSGELPARPQRTPQGPSRLMPRSGSAVHLHDLSTQLNSSMSCDELMTMLDSVTNPGRVYSSGAARTGSPSSRPRKRSASDLDTVPEPPLPPPALRNTVYDHTVQLQQLQQEQQQLAQQQQQMQQQLSQPAPMPKLMVPQTQQVAASPFQAAQQPPVSMPRPFNQARGPYAPQYSAMQYSASMPIYNNMGPQSAPMNAWVSSQMRAPSPPPRMNVQMPMMQQGTYPSLLAGTAAPGAQRNLMPFGAPNPYTRPSSAVAAPCAPAPMTATVPVASALASKVATLPLPVGLPKVRVSMEKKKKTASPLTTVPSKAHATTPGQPLGDLASPYGSLSPVGKGGEPSVISLPQCDDDNGQINDINHIHLSPEEFDAVLAAFDTPGLEDAQ